MDNWKEIDAFAKKWTKEAGERIRASFTKTLDIQTKSNPNDLVTEIDQDVERFFIAKIRETFPNHRILGEEGFGDSLEDLSGITWIIDPIDGTMNFVHQQRNFAISVGIYEHGTGRVGLIYDVVHDELYHCVKGEGVYLNEEQLVPLEEVNVHEALIGINASWLTNEKRPETKMLIPLVRDIRGTRSFGSAAMEMVYVATGRMDGYISLRLSPWDFAAGIIMVEELGGVATTLKGEELDMLSTSSLFVAKPGLHQQVIHNYLNDGNW